MPVSNPLVIKPVRVRGGQAASSGSNQASADPPQARYTIAYQNPDDLIGSRPPLRDDKRGRQAESLQRNLRRFGCVLPVLVDENGAIISGHALVAAAKAIGLATIPTTTITGLSEPEIRALRISLHKVEDLSSWNRQRERDRPPRRPGTATPTRLDRRGRALGHR